MPNIGESRTANGETRVWNGAGWARTDPRGVPMISLPPPQPSGRTDAQDLEALKQLLTIGGATTAGLFLGPEASIPTRMAMSALMGSGGRATGHGIEAMTNAASRTPNPNGPTLAEDAGIGGVEGAGMEVAPSILSPVMRYGGAALRTVGDFFGGGGKVGPWVRAIIGRELGGTPGAAVAVAAPPVVSATGRGLESAGEALGTRTTSQRVQDAVDAISDWMKGTERPVVDTAAPPSRFGMSRGRDVPYRMGSGVSGPFEEPTPELYARSTDTLAPADPVFERFDPNLDEPGSGGFSRGDVTLTRELANKGYRPSTAIKIATGGARLTPRSLGALQELSGVGVGDDAAYDAASKIQDAASKAKASMPKAWQALLP